MKKSVVVLTVAAALGLSGCGGAYDVGTQVESIQVTLKDGSVVDCVKVVGGEGSVAIDCDFAE